MGNTVIFFQFFGGHRGRGTLLRTSLSRAGTSCGGGGIFRGNRKALYEASPHGTEGNVTQNCKVLPYDCKDTIFAVKGDKIVVASGLHNYIVAENDNALLIYPIEEEQRIRHIVNDVRTRFGEDYV